MTAYPAPVHLPATSTPSRHNAATVAHLVGWLAAAALAAAVWTAAPSLTGQGAQQPVTAGGFGGGTYPVRPVEYAPQLPSDNRLVQVRCAGRASSSRSCWVSRP